MPYLEKKGQGGNVGYKDCKYILRGELEVIKLSNIEVIFS